MSLNIRGKIVLVSFLGLFAAIGANSLVISLMFNQEYADARRSEAFLAGRVLVSQLEHLLKLHIPVDQILGFEDQCQELVSKYSIISYAMVLDDSGRILFHNDISKHGKLVSNKDISGFIKSHTEEWRISILDRVEYYDLFLPVIGTSHNRVATVRIGFPVAHINRKTSRLVGTAFLIAFVFMVLGIIGVVSALTFWVIKPLNSLMTIIEKIKDKGTITKIDINTTSGDEIGRLADTFNGMAARLSSDMARRKLIEKELKNARDKAESANEAKTEFLANVSHELRTPMHHILNYSRFGIQKTHNVPREKLNHYFLQIRKTGTRLMVFLNDLLDISQLQSGKSILHWSKEDLNEMVRDVISESTLVVVEKSVTIDLVGPEEPVFVDCDALKIGQVVRNLIDNAIKFAPTDSKITIKLAESKTHESNQPVKTLRFSIADAGPGVPENELTTIFEKFTQSSRTKTGAGGTGLGLAICEEIIKAHHGKIWVENNADKGATFSFELPLIAR